MIDNFYGDKLTDTSDPEHLQDQMDEFKDVLTEKYDPKKPHDSKDRTPSAQHGGRPLSPEEKARQTELHIETVKDRARDLKREIKEEAKRARDLIRERADRFIDGIDQIEQDIEYQYRHGFHRSGNHTSPIDEQGDYKATDAHHTLRNYSVRMEEHADRTKERMREDVRESDARMRERMEEMENTEHHIR